MLCVSVVVRGSVGDWLSGRCHFSCAAVVAADVFVVIIVNIVFVVSRVVAVIVVDCCCHYNGFISTKWKIVVAPVPKYFIKFVYIALYCCCFMR